MGVSFILGPLLGGFIADGIGWRWVFLVNLPIGLVALAVVATVLPASIGRSEDRRTKLDLKGIALLTLAIGLVLIGLSEREAVLLVAGLVPLAAFVLGRAPRVRADHPAGAVRGAQDRRDPRRRRVRRLRDVRRACCCCRATSRRVEGASARRTPAC